MWCSELNTDVFFLSFIKSIDFDSHIHTHFFVNVIHLFLDEFKLRFPLRTFKRTRTRTMQTTWEKSWNKNLRSTGGSGTSLSPYVLSKMATGGDVMDSFCRVQFSVFRSNPYYVHREHLKFAWSVSRNNYLFSSQIIGTYWASQIIGTYWA